MSNNRQKNIANHEPEKNANKQNTVDKNTQ